MYKALESFATKNYDVKRKQILEDDFTTQDEINEFLEIGYIEEYDGTLEISENGMYDVKEYENADVNVSGSDPVLQSKSLTITENGTQTVSPDTGYDGLSSVAITTNVSGTAEKAVLPSATSLSFRNGRFANTDFLKLLDTSKMSIAQNMFQSCIYIQTIPLIDTSNMVYMQNMFYECYELTSIPSLDTSKVTTMQGFCYDDKSLLSVPQLNTSKVTNMSQAFYGCKRITEFPLLDTGLVTSFYETFSKCEGLVSMPQLNTINATDMTTMFNECSSLSEESLNNILAMCITASKISSTNKNLKYIGLTSSQATTCQGLSNYQAFLDAGWTTGY